MAIFEKGYLFQPSFLDILETFAKASDRDAINMAIHRFMFRGEEPVFSNVELKRTWISIIPYLRKSRNMALKKDKGSQDNVGTMSPQGQDEVETSSAPSQDKVYLKEMRYIRNKDEGDTPNIPKGKVSPEFEKFWDAYPKTRRVKKQAAIKAFDKARPIWKNDGKTIDDIVSALERQKKSEAWTKDNGAYIPHPTSWLNQGRWDDIVEHIEPKAEEKEDEYHPIVPLDKCQVCGSKNVTTRGIYSVCNGCGVSYTWHNRWVEDN